MVRINPSILAADFANLERDVAKISNADFIHVDVMDNHFVPNLTFGLQMVQRLQEVSTPPLDVHLMIDDVDRWAPDYARTGASSVTFHAEATENPVQLARTLRALGCRAGLALKPGTDEESYLELVPEFDQILVMTVEPGFGGQSFMVSTMPKVRRFREAADRYGVETWLQVDGGVDENTIGIARDAGADTFVAGSAVFRSSDPAAQVEALRAAAGSHSH